MYWLSPEYILKEGATMRKKRDVTGVIRFVSSAFYDHQGLNHQEHKRKGGGIRL
jgi:hypothetical protein